MAAPLGFKTFNTGDVLSAADTNGYLMQGVLVFADAAARSAAITSPQEGQTSYLKDTDVIQVYSGAAWVTKSGGSSPLTTKGDLYTYSTTDARLAVGTNGHTLVADSSEATGLKWAAPAGGGKVLQVVQGTKTSVFTTTSATYVDLGLSVSITPSSATSKIMVMVSGYTYVYRSGSGTDSYGSLALVGGATQLQEHNIGYYQLASTSNAEIYIPMNFSYLDSPATTSAITYKTQGKVYSASTTLYLIAGATTIASIVAMEIGA